jgi:hypothetical protein
MESEEIPSTSFYKTYRVQGIPAALTKGGCRELLNAILEDGDEDLKLTVHSLCLDPHSSEHNPFQTATITFNRVPRSLQGNRSEWNLPITSNDGTTVPPHIRVDSHFLGITPLNSTEDNPDHEIE